MKIDNTNLVAKIEECKREVAFGEMFKGTMLYRMLTEYFASGCKKGIAAIQREIKEHPEYGMIYKSGTKSKGETFGPQEGFFFNPDVFRCGSMFVYYNNQFDFDEDLARAKRFLAMNEKEMAMMKSYEEFVNSKLSAISTMEVEPEDDDIIVKGKLLYAIEIKSYDINYDEEFSDYEYCSCIDAIVKRAEDWLSCNRTVIISKARIVNGYLTASDTIVEIPNKKTYRKLYMD